RETEVAQIRALAVGLRRHQDVPGLDVAVDEAGAMRRVERSGDLRHDCDTALGIESSFAPQYLTQVRPVHVRHGEVEHSFVLTGGERRRDVRMVELRGDLRLAQEALTEAAVARELGREDLQRDSSAALHVLREEDRSHRARPDRAVDPESGYERPAANLRRHACSEVRKHAPATQGPLNAVKSAVITTPRKPTMPSATPTDVPRAMKRASPAITGNVETDIPIPNTVRGIAIIVVQPTDHPLGMTPEGSRRARVGADEPAGLPDRRHRGRNRPPGVRRRGDRPLALRRA